MTDWGEDDSAIYRDLAAVAVPRRLEMLATLIALVPFSPDESARIVELSSGEGRLAAALLECFPQATLVALEGSESMRTESTVRLAPFADRARVGPFDVGTLDWWEVLFGADVVVSSLALHHLNDTKKRYVYKAIADRITRVNRPRRSVRRIGSCAFSMRGGTTIDSPIRATSRLSCFTIWCG